MDVYAPHAAVADIFDMSIEEICADSLPGSEQKEKSPAPLGVELSESKRRAIERIISGSDAQADFVVEVINHMK